MYICIYEKFVTVYLPQRLPERSFDQKLNLLDLAPYRRIHRESVSSVSQKEASEENMYGVWRPELIILRWILQGKVLGWVKIFDIIA